MHCSCNSPKGVARLVVRIGFGLTLIFTGFAHYLDSGFADAVGSDLGVLQPLGMIWGYVLPGLMIVGGLLLAFGIYMIVASYITSIALVSIPAGLMLKSAIGGLPVADMMPMAINAFVWILVMMIAIKGSNCGCGSTSGCGTDTSSGAGKPVPAVKTAPMAVVSAKPVVKKVPVKKPPLGKKMV